MLNNASRRLAALCVAAVLLFALTACGGRNSLPGAIVQPTPEEIQIPEEPQDDDEIVLPAVMELDGCIAVSSAVLQADHVTSQGWEAHQNGQTGTNGASGLNVEMVGTSLTLRAFELGEYAYALYGQHVGTSPKPLQTLIDSEACEYGGERHEPVPLSYFAGIADYTVGCWRWFGPFGEKDVLVTVNSDTLKSRFKSPANNFYLCVVAASESNAAGGLPTEGLIADFPFEANVRRASQGHADAPGGITIETIVTTMEENLATKPALMAGLAAMADEAGVYLSWDVNLEPDVDIYEVLRDDPDDAEPGALLQAVSAPTVTCLDSTGVPGKEYEYLVRARNDFGFGGPSAVKIGRLIAAPTVTASDGVYEDRIRVSWTEVTGAVNGYRLYRAATTAGTPLAIDTYPSTQTFFDDYEPLLGDSRWYWVQALGEDMNSPLGGPDGGTRLQLDPGSTSATDGDYPGRVEVIWGADPAAESYIVYRSYDDTGAGLTRIAEVYAPQTSFNDTTAPWAEERWYSVARIIAGIEQPRGEGDWGHRGLATPQDVSASQGTDAFLVTISWKPVNHSTRYKVYRSALPDDPMPVEAGQVDVPQTSFTDIPQGWGITEGLRYYYYVLALHTGPDDERSSLSIAVEGWRGLGVPQDVTATDGDYMDKVVVTWESVAQAEGYRVYRGWSFLGQVDAPETAYIDPDVTPGTVYSYQVSAFITVGEGAMSAAVLGRANIPPTAELSANPTTGNAPLTVDFDASGSYDPDGSIVEYEWDWEGDGIYDLFSGTVATAYHHYAMPGEYDAMVRVTDVDGSMATDTTVISSLNSLPVAELAANPTDGDAPLLVHFTASGSNDPDGGVLEFVWDWEGDGTYDHNSGAEAIVSHEYTERSEYVATVRVTDDEGTNDNASITITIHDWVVVIVDSAGDVGEYTSLAVVNGHPAISYYDKTNGDLKYVRASDGTGSTWGTPVTPDNVGVVGRFTSLALVNGHPAISYYDWTNYDLKYVRATDANGSTWGTPVAPVAGSVVGMYSSLAVVNGNPAIAYNHGWNDKYVRATDAAGNAWGTPVIFDSSDEPRSGSGFSLAVLHGKPSISYQKETDLKYVRAVDDNGDSWFEPCIVDNIGVTGSSSLAEVNGSPAISYYDWMIGDLLYVMAKPPYYEWGRPIILDSKGDMGQYTSLAVINGIPAVAYYGWYLSKHELKYIRAMDADGNVWNTPASIDSSADVGRYPSLKAVNGNPAVSYYDYTNSDLKFACLH